MRITGTKILAKMEQRYNYESEVLLEQISTSMSPGGLPAYEGRPTSNPAERNPQKGATPLTGGWHQSRGNGTKRDSKRNNEKNGTADETTDNLLPRPRVQGEVASIAALPKWLRREMQYLTSP